MIIALIGYGKMGKAIEEIALERGHSIGLKIDLGNSYDFLPEKLQQCNVAIEFTGPESAKGNIEKCLNAGVPTISGSTGWLDALKDMQCLAIEKNTAFLYASNFSIGVNIFFELNKKLAQLMNGKTGYSVSMEEIHHTAKKDAPSGTAITLAEGIIAEGIAEDWVLAPALKDNTIPITAKRIDPAPGTHIVKYSSEVDDIEIIHTAHSRKGFALGAVLAAEFLAGKKGVYSMKDVLGI